MTHSTFQGCVKLPYKRPARLRLQHILSASSIGTAKMAFTLRSLFLLCGISGLLAAVRADKNGNYCPQGWTQLDDKCYIFVQQQRTFIDAEQICILRGGNLVSILDAKENALVLELIRDTLGDIQDTWIGQHDGVEEGTFLWTDGSPVDFGAYTAPQPDNFNGVEDCVEISSQTEAWNDDECTDVNFFVCIKEAHEH
ncbi:galactose-specific lectin nattectin-like isoform X2 [Phycodurus eques]|uniref:galactose-specific lectin nattectin-like isoform X2 n=2 Tax=Phycodurus eques TaxID=693459 RepID=UPI002ACDE077|nr:galactose-specific lectin nattectin-like isoform X2 [Phycodurus eques]